MSLDQNITLPFSSSLKVKNKFSGHLIYIIQIILMYISIIIKQLLSKNISRVRYKSFFSVTKVITIIKLNNLLNPRLYLYYNGI